MLEEWQTGDLGMISRETKSCFGNRYSEGENGEQRRDDRVKDVNGQILRDGVKVRRMWAEYFEQVLNVEVSGGKYKCSWR